MSADAQPIQTLLPEAARASERGVHAPPAFREPDDGPLVLTPHEAAKAAALRAPARVKRAGGPADILRALENRHRWLLFAQHCYTCTRPEDTCDLGKLCTYGKKTLKHVAQCDKDDCAYPRCTLLKPLLMHSRKCQSPTCAVCVPVWNYIQKEVQQQQQQLQLQHQVQQVARQQYVQDAQDASVASTGSVRQGSGAAADAAGTRAAAPHPASAAKPGSGGEDEVPALPACREAAGANGGLVRCNSSSNLTSADGCGCPANPGGAAEAAGRAAAACGGGGGGTADGMGNGAAPGGLQMALGPQWAGKGGGGDGGQQGAAYGASAAVQPPAGAAVTLAYPPAHLQQQQQLQHQSRPQLIPQQQQQHLSGVGASAGLGMRPLQHMAPAQLAGGHHAYAALGGASLQAKPIITAAPRVPIPAGGPALQLQQQQPAGAAQHAPQLAHTYPPSASVGAFFPQLHAPPSMQNAAGLQWLAFPGLATMTAAGTGAGGGGPGQASGGARLGPAAANANSGPGGWPGGGGQPRPGGGGGGITLYGISTADAMRAGGVGPGGGMPQGYMQAYTLPVNGGAAPAGAQVAMAAGPVFLLPAGAQPGGAQGAYAQPMAYAVQAAAGPRGNTSAVGAVGAPPLGQPAGMMGPPHATLMGPALYTQGGMVPAPGGGGGGGGGVAMAGAAGGGGAAAGDVWGGYVLPSLRG